MSRGNGLNDDSPGPRNPVRTWAEQRKEQDRVEQERLRYEQERLDNETIICGMCNLGFLRKYRAGHNAVFHGQPDYGRSM